MLSSAKPPTGPQRKWRQAHRALRQLQQVLGETIPLFLRAGAAETADRFAKRFRSHRVVEVAFREGHSPCVCGATLAFTGGGLDVYVEPAERHVCHACLVVREVGRVYTRRESTKCEGLRFAWTGTLF